MDSNTHVDLDKATKRAMYAKVQARLPYVPLQDVAEQAHTTCGTLYKWRENRLKTLPNDDTLGRVYGQLDEHWGWDNGAK